MSSGMTTGSASRRLVTAFFDSRTDAEEAISRLHAAGVARDGIRLTTSDQDTRTSGGTGTQSFPEASNSLWDSLRDLFLPDEDRHTYAEGLRRGEPANQERRRVQSLPGRQIVAEQHRDLGVEADGLVGRHAPDDDRWATPRLWIVTPGPSPCPGGFRPSATGVPAGGGTLIGHSGRFDVIAHAQSGFGGIGDTGRGRVASQSPKASRSRTWSGST